jgi:hypothetical protein
MQNMEKGVPSAQKRVQSDIELAAGGAEYVPDAVSTKLHLEVTPEQVDNARQMMKEEQAQKDQVRIKEIQDGIRKIELDIKEGESNVQNMNRGSYLRSQERKWGEAKPEDKRAA